jgi:protein-tyrosine phosphatase
MRNLVAAAGMENEIEMDSAGTGAWHVGSGPDPRATAAAASQGVVLSGQARKVAAEDFERFDLILAMDASNLGDLRAMARDDDQRAKVHLLREFDPELNGAQDVPDPYYGDGDGFTHVFTVVHDACEGLLAELAAGRLP